MVEFKIRPSEAQFVPGSTRMWDFLNTLREEMIQAQAKALKQLEMIENEFALDIS